MPAREVNGYALGQFGWIEVLDAEGKQRRYLQGEIVRLIPAGEDAVWALIWTRMGTGAYRLW